MTTPRVTVAIPTYNRAELLDVCLTVTRQAPAYVEIVVVDNASTDATPDVVARHAAEDDRIRSLRNETNIGMVGNFNAAMRAAQGEYISVLCDDDLILPGNFERKVPILDSNPEVGFVYSPWHMIDEAGRSLGVPLGSGMLPYAYVGGRDEFGDLLQNNHLMMNAVLFRRELFDRLGGLEPSEELHPSYDWEMWLRYTRQTQTAYVAEPLVCVRYHGEQSSSNYEGLAKARIAIWQRWLTRQATPLVLNENVWERMRALFHQDLNYWFQGDAAKVMHYLNQFETLRQENRRQAAARFDGFIRASLPTEAVVASAGTGQRQSVEPVIWTAPLLDTSGYAEEARHFVLALDSEGYDVRAQIIPTQGRAQLPLPVTRRLAEMSQRPPVGRVHVSHVTAPEFIRHPQARWNVGRTMFETDRIPDDWVAACNRMDAVWVPSEFNYETFTRSGVDARKIQIVPGAIDVAEYDLNTAPLAVDGARGYNFLSVFDWTLRKGWDILLRAYIEEFSAEEDVALLIKTSSYPERGYTLEHIGGMAMQFVAQELKRDPNHIPDIVMMDTHIPAQQLPALYRAADCFVLPSHGEGWGRPYMEAMAMAMPVIATNWSGNTAFMTAENSLLLDYNVVDVPEIAWREKDHLRGHRWAEPDVTHLRARMRQAFTDREGAKAIGTRARADLAERFSYARVAAIIGELLGPEQATLAA